MNSTPHITDCIFTENIATGVTDGGAIYNEGSSPVITNYIFSGNTADEGGAIYNCENSSPTVTNCAFSGNSADKGGGAIYIYDNCSPIITNCTFFGNSATYWGGAICNAYGFPTITNCILWGNTAEYVAEINDFGTSESNVTYSDIQGGMKARET